MKLTLSALTTLAIWSHISGQVLTIEAQIQDPITLLTTLRPSIHLTSAKPIFSPRSSPNSTHAPSTTQKFTTTSAVPTTQVTKSSTSTSTTQSPTTKPKTTTSTTQSTTQTKTTTVTTQSTTQTKTTTLTTQSTTQTTSTSTTKSTTQATTSPTTTTVPTTATKETTISPRSTTAESPATSTTSPATTTSPNKPKPSTVIVTTFGVLLGLTTVVILILYFTNKCDPEGVSQRINAIRSWTRSTRGTEDNDPLLPTTVNENGGQ